MDPIADKLLIVAALVSLVSLNRLEAWVAMVIIAREFAVTVMRAIAAERGIVIAASWLGKVKTVLQIAAVFALIAANPAPAWVDALVYLAVAATVISGADYFFGLRRRIEEEREARVSAEPRRVRPRRTAVTPRAPLARPRRGSHRTPAQTLCPVHRRGNAYGATARRAMPTCEVTTLCPLDVAAGTRR